MKEKQASLYLILKLHCFGVWTISGGLLGDYVEMCLLFSFVFVKMACAQVLKEASAPQHHHFVCSYFVVSFIIIDIYLTCSLQSGNPELGEVWKSKTGNWLF